MRVIFKAWDREVPADKLGDVELELDGALVGCKLVGLSVWKAKGDDRYARHGMRLSWPSREYTDRKGAKRTFSYVRSTYGKDMTALDQLRDRILDEVLEHAGGRQPEPPPEEEVF